MLHCCFVSQIIMPALFGLVLPKATGPLKADRSTPGPIARPNHLIPSALAGPTTIALSLAAAPGEDLPCPCRQTLVLLSSNNHPSFNVASLLYFQYFFLVWGLPETRARLIDASRNMQLISSQLQYELQTATKPPSYIIAQGLSSCHQFRSVPPQDPSHSTKVARLERRVRPGYQ